MYQLYQVYKPRINCAKCIKMADCRSSFFEEKKCLGYKNNQIVWVKNMENFLTLLKIVPKNVFSFVDIFKKSPPCVYCHLFEIQNGLAVLLERLVKLITGCWAH